jgi:hypothetical protein
MAVVEPTRADHSQVFTGNTAGAPTFNRPFVNPGSSGLSGVFAHYRAQGFSLSENVGCVINSVQDYDGYLLLYRPSFNPNDPLANLVAGNDDGELGESSSRLPSDPDVANTVLFGGNYVLVTTGFDANGQGAFQNFVQCNGDVQPEHGTAAVAFQGIPSHQQVRLHDRFVVAIDQVSNHAGNGIATPVRFGSNDSAFFWFFNDTNFEVLIKVLDACEINGHWWVFFAGTTNQAYRVRVADATTQQIQVYHRFEGPPSPAETDTATVFPCPP